MWQAVWDALAWQSLVGDILIILLVAFIVISTESHP